MILGISLDKISVERKDYGKGEFKVSYASEIEDIKEADIAAMNEKVGELLFSFDVTYTQAEKDVGSLKFKGSVLWKGDLKELKEKWAANKKLPEGVGLTVLNGIYRKCLILGAGLSEQLGLPSPIPMPRVSLKKNEK